jgi:2',3'-cyclic-nucleotide 2'-phosphodiesterase (5'-nucleotidase family)
VHTDCAIYNSGSVRIDDVLTGYITQYDIFRVLPFENKIVIKELEGRIIDSLLKTNANRQKDGSFLQYAGIVKQDTAFYINGKLLYNDTAHYKVVMNYYLAMGMQPGLTFIGGLQPAADTSPQLNIRNNDMRKALIQKLKKNSGNKQWPAANGKVPCY